MSLEAQQQDYCSVVAEFGRLGCALSSGGPRCEDNVLAELARCEKTASQLAPAPCGTGQANPQSAPPRLVMLDPVPDLINQEGTDVTTDTETLATQGTEVIGVASDGASRAVLRIYASCPGEKITVRLESDGAPNQNNLQYPDGRLKTLLPADGTAMGSQITVTAVATSQGPMAFAVYFPSSDFSRGGADDQAKSRSLLVLTPGR